MIVTIDGPAGSGKSTVANKLANKLGFIHLNSGALFRAVALKAVSQGVSLDDEEAVAALAAATRFDFELVPAVRASGNRSETGQATRLLVDGQDCTEQINTAQAGKLASKIAVLPKLRDILLRVQRSAAESSPVVVEGRDAGTVVFPAADIKFYLDASLEVRARRRFTELRAAGSEELSIEEVLQEIGARDHRDSTREVAPQVPAKDAEHIDTSFASVDEIVERLCDAIERKRKSSAT